MDLTLGIVSGRPQSLILKNLRIDIVPCDVYVMIKK